MKKLIQKILIAVSILGGPSVYAASAISPVSIGLMPPVQFPSDDFAITGARISLLYGHHRNVYGLDIGALGNITDQTFTGMALSGLFNNTRGTTNILGLQAAGLTNINTGKVAVYGLQVALGVNYQSAASDVYGVQFAVVNQAAFTDIVGLQVGVYNRAKDVYGFQIGVVNIAENLHGIQIGLINFHNKGLISVSPIINIGF